MAEDTGLNPAGGDEPLGSSILPASASKPVILLCTDDDGTVMERVAQWRSLVKIIPVIPEDGEEVLIERKGQRLYVTQRKQHT